MTRQDDQLSRGIFEMIMDLFGGLGRRKRRRREKANLEARRAASRSRRQGGTWT